MDRDFALVYRGGLGLFQVVEEGDGSGDGDEAEGDEGWFPWAHAGAGSFDLLAEIDQAIGGVGVGEDLAGG